MSDGNKTVKKRLSPTLHTIEPWTTCFPGVMFWFQALEAVELKDN